MLPLAPNLFAFPILHGRAACSLALRKHLMERSYSALALPLPACIQAHAETLVDELPVVHALVLRQGELCAYFPADPCDAYVETIRVAQQGRTPLRFVAPNRLPNPRTALGLPDPWTLEKLDLRAWVMTQLPFLKAREEAVDSEDWFQHVIEGALASSKLGKTLLVCHVTEFTSLQKALASHQSGTSNLLHSGTPELTSELWPIKPAHLFFALGEMPFHAGYFEQNRQDPFSALPDAPLLAKQLLLKTRDILEENGLALKISPTRIQAALRFARRLARQDGLLVPGLFDWVTAAKGVLGDAFAARLLEYAQTYPFSPEPGPMLKLGMDKLRTPLETEARDAWNILRDMPRVWRAIRLRKEPKPEEQTKWRHQWDDRKACSHLPEDLRIERFNIRARAQALRALQARHAVSAPFTSSLLDGVDLRETIRHWHLGQLWVKETPPHRGRIDTVIVIFDEEHDDRFPYRHTWYAEHNEESTLSFYATDPYSDMVGPGICRARYGGVAMLFPPRHVPDIFEVPGPDELSSAEQLAYGSMLHSRERLVAYYAERRPGIRLRELARRLGKHLVWTPLRHFRQETLETLRTFHVLNGQKIRSIASRFIGY